MPVDKQQQQQKEGEEKVGFFAVVSLDESFLLLRFPGKEGFLD